ncbi:MAG: DedA family protein [Nitrososphaerota archaeon]|nr:DedA family protein [Nitrososphaerota archaeon]MDG6966483.1 DedA family protein [Nitrososphaerota archaeon]MDG6978658.1 DedA family protein [Nitrososphaerota archaeon]
MTVLGRALPAPSLGLRHLALFASVGVLVASLTEMLDVVELPFESTAAHLAASGSVVSMGFLTASLGRFGYAGLFALMALESASLPVPSEVVLPFAGYLVYTKSLSFAGVVLVSTGAGVVGALVDYYLALEFGRPLVAKLFDWFGGGREGMARAERWLGARGAWSILVARFVPGLRSSISLPAGALKMKMGAFLAMTFLGSLGWSALLVYLGFSAGPAWRAVASGSGALQALLPAAAAASLLYIGYFAYRWIMSRARPATSSIPSPTRAPGTA